LPISAADAIDPAFRHTKEQLLRPFRFGQWARLALVGALAGEMGSSGSCNFNYPLNTQHRPSQQALLSGSWPSYATNHPALFAGIVAALIVIGLVLVVLVVYIGSVMRFVLFDSIIAKECHIRKGWARRKGPGLRLFWWQIVFMLASLATFAIVIVIPIACVGSVLLGVIHVMTKDFVVPQMALEDISAIEGWRRLWLWLKADKGGYAGYIGMKIVLAIGAAILVFIVDLIVMLVLLIPFGGFGIAAVLGGKAAGWTWNFYTIALAVVLGCIALAILIFILALISVPVIVFFPAYSIYFFAQRYSPLASLLWPQSPAPAATG
jgi:hypothetical protein